MVRDLQPTVLIDDRLEADGGPGSIVTGSPTDHSGDFASPEQLMPVDGIPAEDGSPVPWEACVTINDNWGCTAGDDLWKSPEKLITKLVECVPAAHSVVERSATAAARARGPAPRLRGLRAAGA
ncbi:alpha-L-fucosidase [Nonomuraea sp. NPDC003754]